MEKENSSAIQKILTGQNYIIGLKICVVFLKEKDLGGSLLAPKYLKERLIEH